MGLTRDAHLRRLLDSNNRPLSIPPGAILLTDRLAQRLEVAPGGALVIEVLEGQRRRLNLPVAGLVNDLIGLSAYMDMDSLNRMAGEGESVSAAALAVDSGQENTFYARLKETPKIATLSMRREALRSFWNTTAKFVLVFSAILSVFAAAIAVGVVLAASAASVLVVRRKVDQLDLVEVLKSRE